MENDTTLRFGYTLKKYFNNTCNFTVLNYPSDLATEIPVVVMRESQYIKLKVALDYYKSITNKNTEPRRRGMMQPGVDVKVGDIVRDTWLYTEASRGRYHIVEDAHGDRCSIGGKVEGTFSMPSGPEYKILELHL